MTDPEQAPSTRERADAGIPANLHGLSTMDIYRASFVSAYWARPRGDSPLGFDPEHASPRWRWAVAASMVVLVTIAAALLAQVPIGPSGTVVGMNGSQMALALPGAGAPRIGERVRLRVDGRALTGQVRDIQRGSGSQLLVVVLVEVIAGASENLPAGSSVTLDEGERPLLVDLLSGGGTS